MDISREAESNLGHSPSIESLMIQHSGEIACN
jgi:hypothetical protein